MQPFLIFFGELVFLFFLSKILIADLGQLLLRVTKSRKWSIYILSFLFLPGTAHEIRTESFALNIIIMRNVTSIPKDRRHISV